MAHFKKIDERLDESGPARSTTAVQKAQANGAQGPELEDPSRTSRRPSTRSAASRTRPIISSLDRLTELMENLSLLTTELSLNYCQRAAQPRIVHQRHQAAGRRPDQGRRRQPRRCSGRAKKHEEERQNLLTKVDQLQTDTDKKTTEIANLEAKIKQQEDDFARQTRHTDAPSSASCATRLEQEELILDQPDGYITYVDYERGEVLVNITRRMGARPQMKMTIFDARSPGIPTEKPKGTIELTKVGDQFSTARIVKTDNPIDPIRVGDIVYSAAWSPNQPMRFALVGKIDVNRDGRDDREELKRMIQEAGGVVDFDLPPVDLGKETGKLTPRIDWYVTDDRMPLRDAYRSAESERVERGASSSGVSARSSRKPGSTASARCRSSGCSPSSATT